MLSIVVSFSLFSNASEMVIFKNFFLYFVLFWYIDVKNKKNIFLIYFFEKTQEYIMYFQYKYTYVFAASPNKKKLPCCCDPKENFHCK